MRAKIDDLMQEKKRKKETFIVKINFIFIYCGLFVIILVVLCCFFFHYVFAKFHIWPSSGNFTATLDRNAESCNRIPSKYGLL